MGQLIDVREGMGQHRRLAQGRQQHRGAEPGTLRNRGQISQGGEGLGVATTLSPTQRSSPASSHRRATVQQTSRGGRRADWSTTARCGSNTPKRITMFPFVYTPFILPCPWCTLHAKTPMTGRYQSMYAMVTALPHVISVPQAQEC